MWTGELGSVPRPHSLYYQPQQYTFGCGEKILMTLNISAVITKNSAQSTYSLVVSVTFLFSFSISHLFSALKKIYRTYPFIAFRPGTGILGHHKLKFDFLPSENIRIMGLFVYFLKFAESNTQKEKERKKEKKRRKEHILLFPLKKNILFISFLRREGRERNINEWLPLKHPLLGTLASNPGMCPDWKSNWQP